MKEALGAYLTRHGLMPDDAGEDYNHRRLHGALQNMLPADVYAGRQGAILDRRARIKRETLVRRKRENLSAA